ncbi:MAG: glycine-rich domain-containing protein [Novosphingobium sp.]
MQRDDHRSLTLPDDPRWHAISHHSIGPDDAALSFAQRLARENGWTAAFAARVIGEYRRFCYLAVTAGHPVTPSDAVDQAWHLHLTYSADYWQTYCPEVLGRALHHGPTAGGSAEHARYFEQYAQTLRSYERAFGAPPCDIWPGAHQRLIVDPQARRVHPREGWIIARPLFAALLLMTLMVGVAAGWALFGRH